MSEEQRRDFEDAIEAAFNEWQSIPRDDSFKNVKQFAYLLQAALSSPQGLLDPDMPAQELRLHMGELTAQEERTARAAIYWANSRMSSPQGGEVGECGLTLRDLYTMAALNGYCARGESYSDPERNKNRTLSWVEDALVAAEIAIRNRTRKVILEGDETQAADRGK